MVKAISVSPEIRSDVCYPLQGLEQLGFGKAAVREMRQLGLSVRRVGRRSFVFGKDLMKFIEDNGKLVA